MAGCGMVRRTPPSGRVPFAYPALHPAPAPPVLAGQEQDARLCNRPSGRPRDLVQQMQEQPGRERRARAVLDYDLPRASDLELAEKTGRRSSDHRLQSFEASGSGSVTGIGGDRPRRRGIHLDLLLDDRAPGQGAEDGQYVNYLVNHQDPLKVSLASLMAADQAVIAVLKYWKSVRLIEFGTAG